MAFKFELGESILGAFVGLIVGAFLTGALRIGRRLGRTALAEALTGFTSHNPPLVVVGAPLRARPGTREQTDHLDGLPLFGYGPLCAYAHLSAELVADGISAGSSPLPSIIISSQFAHLPDTDKCERDLILIGWPFGNEATALLEPMMLLPVKFANHERKILDARTEEVLGEAVYEDTPDGHRRVLRDCGLLVRTPHPMNPHCSVLYLAGCDTFGVKVAAEGLQLPHVGRILSIDQIVTQIWSYSWLPKLGLSKLRNRAFVALFSASVDQLATGKPELNHAWTKSTSNPKATWVKAFVT